MTNASSVPTPLPGAVPSGDPSDPIQALARFYRAFNDRDLAVMEQVWEHSAEVEVISPLVRGIARGWPTLHAGYARVFDGPDRIETEFYDYTIHAVGGLFYAVGRERGRMMLGGRTIPAEGRATNVFRRAPDGTWKLVHHHISLDPAPDAGSTGGAPGEAARSAPPGG